MAKRASKPKPKPICQVGDRILAPRNRWGTCIDNTHTSIIPYKIRWDNGHEATYKKDELKRYQIHPPEPKAEDIEEEDLAQLNLNFSREEGWKVGDRCTTTSECDWQPGELIIIDASDPNNTVVEVSGRPAVLAAKFLQRWNPSPNLTYVAESASDSPLLDYNSEVLSSSDCVREMNTVSQSSSLDIQTHPSTQKSRKSQAENLDTTSREREESTLSPPPLLALLSQSKESDSEQQTGEIVSQQLSKRSQPISHDSLPLKMSGDSLAVPTNQGSRSNTLQESSLNFPSAGTMRSGKWFPADILPPPSLENDCFWLDSPGALSSDVSRAPGQSRLEASLKKTGHLQSGECINPAFLEGAFAIPLGWSDRLVSRSAIALLEEREKHSVTHSIHESQRSPCKESCTSTASLKTEEELTPVDDSAISKHFWYDEDTIAVEVLSVQNWRETPKSKELIKVARCRPWWTHENGKRIRADVIVLPLSELTELEEEDFSSPVPEQALVDKPSSLEKCPSCNQSLITLDDGCGICGWTSSLQKPEIHTERACHTGSLYKDTKWQETKLGRVEYPKVNGYRDSENEDHWYWYLSYVVKDGNHKKASAKGNGGFKDCTAYVPRSNLPLVRSLIRHSVPVEVTLEVVGLKFLWLDFKGSWAIGEVKPETCPRLCLISMEEKQVFIIPSSEWGELGASARREKQRLISEAIASGKTLSYIKEAISAERVPQTNSRTGEPARTG